jgi:hypothetical protein
MIVVSIGNSIGGGCFETSVCLPLYSVDRRAVVASSHVPSADVHNCGVASTAPALNVVLRGLMLNCVEGLFAVAEMRASNRVRFNLLVDRG